MSDAKPIPIRILHLEDSPLDAELTYEVMADAGIDCAIDRMVSLESFQQALAEYPSNWKYDLVLADYKMPGFDGMKALQVIREVDANIPFILLSGALGEELAVELLRNGATDYVLKHNLQRLPLVVRRAIAEHESRLREIRNQDELRRARDEAQKANSAKGRFLGRISHELRTPLNAILGYTQLMQSDPMSDEQQHCAQQILKAGEHLLQLINEVLDITRIESGAISVNVKPTSITSVIERAADLVRPLARENGVTIHLDSGPCDMFAMVDRDRLAQVLINLLTNAIKYNHEQGHVYVECQDESPMLKILVRDTGIGIAQDKIDRLFTPFDRLDAEKDTRIPGTGLGLTVSRALIEAMGGAIGVTTAGTGGTVFWLEMPAATPSDLADDAHENFVGGVAASTAKLPVCDVLLVEDHEASRDFLERVFRRRCNLRLVSTASIDAAIEKLSEFKPQIVITDLNFGERQGEELIQHIKNSPEISDIPIIVTTIDPSEAREKAVRAMNVAEYFLKPLKINPFLQAIADNCKSAPECDASDK